MKKNWFSIVIAVAVIVGVVAILIIKLSAPKSNVPMPKEGELTIVEVGQELCIPCKLLKPIMQEMRVELEGKATVMTLLIDNDVKAAYSIKIIPTIIIYDKQRNEVTRRIVTEEEVPEVKDWIRGKLTDLGMQL